MSSDRPLEPLERRTLLSDTLDAALPRFLTAQERDALKQHPIESAGVRVPSAPPTGPVDPVSEYDPMEALVISWTGSTSWLNILGQITRRVTVEANARMYIGVTSASVQTSATSTLNSLGANLANVTFFTVALNSIWARDYGPRYVYEGDVRVITDHQYNRPRPSDDLQPVVFGQFKQHKYYEIGTAGSTLIHGGGNYHLASDGDAYATRLIVNENPALTQAQVQQVWNTYQNNNTTITDPFPTSVDATQHIDMWMQIYDDKKVFISDWPSAQGSVQDNICEATATLMQSRGYTVTRIPAYSIGGTHYTFTNMVIFNNIVLLPQYNNGPGATVSNQVLATVQAAFGPGKTVYQVNGDSIVTAAGVFHCIVQHIPQHRGLPGRFGGLAPTAMLRGPNNSPVFTIGSQVNLEWITDDDAPVASTAGVQSVEIQLSTDGGQTFPISIASGRPALGSFNWSIPTGIETTQAKIRVVATDALGNTGFDDSDAVFTIDTVAPSVAGNTFAFETEQRIDLSLNEPATLLGATLTNLDTNQTLNLVDLAVTPSGSTLSIRKASGLLADGDWRLTIPAGQLRDSAGNNSTAPATFDFFVLAGDANRDRTVNIGDFSTLAANFNQPGTFSAGDFNYSGGVEIGDFSILAAQYNVSLASARAAPPGAAPAMPANAFSNRAIDQLEAIDPLAI